MQKCINFITQTVLPFILFNYFRYVQYMSINITRIRGDDAGEYNCVAKNDLGLTRGTFKITITDQRYHSYQDTSVAIFGNQPPPKEGYEDICPPQAPCECNDQRDIKCKDSVYNVFDLTGGKKIESELMNSSYPVGPQNKSTDCILYAVGKPVYHKYTDQNYGSWLRDTNPKDDIVGEKIWVTNERDFWHILEYPNKTSYREDSNRKEIRLETPWMVSWNLFIFKL